MNTMREAFDRAGLPTASVAFAAACHDLARLALNRCGGNPERAMPVFLGHIDNRARRYAEKKLICDIWRAWRAA